MSWPDWTSLIVGVGIGFYAALRRSGGPSSALMGDRPVVIPPSPPLASISSMTSPIATLTDAIEEPPIAPDLVAIPTEIFTKTLTEPATEPTTEPATEPATESTPPAGSHAPIGLASNPASETDPASTTVWASAFHLAKQWGEFQGGFLARTAHELRSPLSSTIGLHQMILNDLCDDPEEERQCVADANQAAQRMVGLLDRLIEVSKINSGAIAPDLQPVSLPMILDEVENLTYLPAANRNIGLEFGPAPEVEVLADPKRLRQAIALVVDGMIAQLAQEGDNGPIELWATTIEHRAQITMQTTSLARTWSDPIDLLQQPLPVPTTLADLKAATQSQLSPMMGLWVAQLAIESMDGSLALVPSDAGLQLTCTLPLA